MLKMSIQKYWEKTFINAIHNLAGTNIVIHGDRSIVNN